MANEELDRLRFTDACQLTVSGRPFRDTERFYSRLPARAEGVVPGPVWGLAQQPTGMTVEFWTDSPILGVEVATATNWDGNQPDSTICADCYVRNEGGRWGWIGIARSGATDPLCRAVAYRGRSARRCLHRIYLPHGTAVDRVAVGVAAGATLEPAPAPATAPRPICFYGTSIVHGFSASRPGMTMPALVGRRLDWPIWNVSFSGNARMDPEVVDFLAELDPAVFTVDCLPNLWPEGVTERTLPLVRRLRAARPATPILLVENIVYQATYMLEDRRGGWGPKNDALRAQYGRILAEGIAGVHYLTGEALLGSDGDGAVDGTHPNDLGMARLADAYEAALRPILPERG